MKRPLTDQDRERIVEAMKQSKSSEGWIYIKETIFEWKAAEGARLRKFESRGMTASDVAEYNRCVDRIEYLERFLVIHDYVMDFNESILARMRDYVEEKFSKAESFIREVI